MVLNMGDDKGEESILLYSNNLLETFNEIVNLFLILSM